MQQIDNASLLKRTTQLLTTREDTLPNIAADTDLSVHWLRKLKHGQIKDPSVNRIQRLYEYLTNSELKV